MKASLSTQLGQQLHLTPQLLQSIRLLQLDGLHLEQEIQRLLDSNPLLEIEDAEAPAAEATDAASTTLDTAAFDELPESSMWDVSGANWQDGDDVVIVPSLKDEEEIKQRFPKGYKAVKPYLRLTPQPNR